MKINVDEILENQSLDLSDYEVRHVKQAMKDFTEKLLELAAENATTYTSDKFFNNEYYVKKESITSVINQIEF